MAKEKDKGQEPEQENVKNIAQQISEQSREKVTIKVDPSELAIWNKAVEDKDEHFIWPYEEVQVSGKTYKIKKA